MVRQDYTALLLIIDRSGSMLTIRDDIEKGLTDMLREQDTLDGKATVDVAYFDNDFEYPTSFGELSSTTIQVRPRGSTALYDAVVRATTQFGQALAALDESERPGKVIVVVATDGQENASREATAEAVKAVVTEQTDKYGWEFVFLGANQDAVLTGSQLGFRKDSSLTYAASASGVAFASASLSNYVTRTRSGGHASFTDADRTAATEV